MVGHPCLSRRHYTRPSVSRRGSFYAFHFAFHFFRHRYHLSSPRDTCPNRLSLLSFSLHRLFEQFQWRLDVTLFSSHPIQPPQHISVTRVIRSILFSTAQHSSPHCTLLHKVRTYIVSNSD